MKKVIALTLALILCLSLCACGNNKQLENTAPSASQDQITEDSNTSEDVTTEESAEEKQPIDVTELSIGDTLATDFVEMTFSDVTIAEDIKYSVTTDIVTRITGPDPIAGQKYVCLSGVIKNISTSPLPVFDFFVGNLDLDGYNYAVEANDCDILNAAGETFFEIDPLMEYTFRIYTAIPETLADSHNSCSFRFGFDDLFNNEELARNRAFEEDPIALCSYQYIVSVK